MSNDADHSIDLGLAGGPIMLLAWCDGEGPRGRDRASADIFASLRVIGAYTRKLDASATRGDRGSAPRSSCAIVTCREEVAPRSLQNLAAVRIRRQGGLTTAYHPLGRVSQERWTSWSKPGVTFYRQGTPRQTALLLVEQHRHGVSAQGADRRATNCLCRKASQGETNNLARSTASVGHCGTWVDRRRSGRESALAAI